MGRWSNVLLLTLSALVAMAAPAPAHDMGGLNHISMRMPLELNAMSLERLATTTPNLDLHTRYIYARLLLWQPGQVLVGCFYDGTRDEKAAVVTNADSLLRGKNVKISFDFGAAPDYRPCAGLDPEGDVRVSFATLCCAGTIGRFAHDDMVKGKSTVDLKGLLASTDAEISRVIMHELLHTLGLDHEHKSPEINCEPEFLKDKIMDDYRWDDETYRRNMQPINRDSNAYKWSDYDSKSIMKYYFKPTELRSGSRSPCYSRENALPSETDYRGIRDAYSMPAVASTPESIRSAFGKIATANAPAAVTNLLRALPSPGR